MTEKKTPLEQALDLFVYAPLGLAMVAKDELPRLIDKGRQQVNGQMAMAKMMGEFAVKQGQKEGAKLVRQTTERLATGGGPAMNGAQAAATAPTPAATATSASTPSAAASPPARAAAPLRNAGSSGRSAPSAAALAIPGYDTLAAPQVVTRLAGLSGDELEAVRTYELATRHRKTIISRIMQLQTPA